MDSSDLSFTQRVAGIVLVLNGLALLAEGMLASKQGGGVMATPVPAVIDMLLGTALAAGFGGVLGWVMIRAILGGVVVTGILFASGNPGMAVLQVCYSGMLLLLLVPHAGKVRATFGVLMATAFVGVQGLGVAMLSSGEDPESWASQMLGGEPADQDADSSYRSVAYEEPAEDPYPEDTFVACDVRGEITFMRESDCKLQGGRF